MKILLELTDRHLDLLKGELKIPEDHYEFLMKAVEKGESPDIPEQYQQSFRILRSRALGLGLGNSKEDCVIKNEVIVMTL